MTVSKLVRKTSKERILLLFELALDGLEVVVGLDVTNFQEFSSHDHPYFLQNQFLGCLATSTRNMSSSTNHGDLEVVAKAFLLDELSDLLHDKPRLFLKLTRDNPDRLLIALLMYVRNFDEAADRVHCMFYAADVPVDLPPVPSTFQEKMAFLRELVQDMVSYYITTGREETPFPNMLCLVQQYGIEWPRKMPADELARMRLMTTLTPTPHSPPPHLIPATANAIANQEDEKDTEDDEEEDSQGTEDDEEEISQGTEDDEEEDSQATEDEERPRAKRSRI
jgi:hypothetical protein